MICCNKFVVGKLWISAFFWHRAIEIWSILQAVRIFANIVGQNHALILTQCHKTSGNVFFASHLLSWSTEVYKWFLMIGCDTRQRTREGTKKWLGGRFRSSGAPPGLISSHWSPYRRSWSKCWDPLTFIGSHSTLSSPWWSSLIIGLYLPPRQYFLFTP